MERRREMSKEKRLFGKGRTTVYVVYPRLHELRHFDGVVFIPTIGTFSLNTLSSHSKYQFTRYTQLQFLWFSIEVRVEYGKIPLDGPLECISQETADAVMEHMRNMGGVFSKHDNNN